MRELKYIKLPVMNYFTKTVGPATESQLRLSWVCAVQVNKPNKLVQFLPTAHSISECFNYLLLGFETSVTNNARAFWQVLNELVHFSILPSYILHSSAAERTLQRAWAPPVIVFFLSSFSPDAVFVHREAIWGKGIIA